MLNKQKIGVKMSKIRMNTELRNKLFNKIKHVFENESTQEREDYLQSRETVDTQYKSAFGLASEIVERAYPPEDVATLRHYKKKYGDAVDVVAKDKCFYFAHNEAVDSDGDTEETKSHFDFGLYGNLNGAEYSNDEGRKFAYAYLREDLKAMDLNPDIMAQQDKNNDNPHKTKHMELNDKALGKTSNSRYNTENDSIGLTKTFNDQFFLDVIGTSYCRSRAIACTQDEYKQLEAWRIAKGQVVATHQTWVDSITKQCDQLKIGLKAYRYLSEAIELATELGIELEESELIRTNSTGLTIYNPKNLADMIKGLKNNKPLTTAQKIEARKQYEASVN
jgi:hypothetical protein